MYILRSKYSENRTTFIKFVASFTFKKMDRIIHTVKIYTDGACRGNPGPGGWGVILIYGKKQKELSGGEKNTTNNRMELTAVIKALEALKRSSDVEIFSDSSYVIRGMNEWVFNWIKKQWKTPDGKLRKNSDLWQTLVDLSNKHNIKWIWVRGHDGHSFNERADQLAVKAIPD